MSIFRAKKLTTIDDFSKTYRAMMGVVPVGYNGSGEEGTPRNFLVNPEAWEWVRRMSGELGQPPAQVCNEAIILGGLVCYAADVIDPRHMGIALAAPGAGRANEDGFFAVPEGSFESRANDQPVRLAPTPKAWSNLIWATGKLLGSDRMPSGASRRGQELAAGDAVLHSGIQLLGALSAMPAGSGVIVHDGDPGRVYFQGPSFRIGADVVSVPFPQDFVPTATSVARQ